MQASRPLTAAYVKEAAYELGFDLCGIAAPRRSHVHMAYFKQWLAAQCHGDMAYLARNLELRADPRRLRLSAGLEVNSIVVLGVDYGQGNLPPAIAQDPARGIIARYASRRDYHAVLKPLLFALDATLRQRSGRRQRAKCWVDTGPVVERDWAMASGLTFTGKNCCAINPAQGSWLFLAVLCIPETVAADPPPFDADAGLAPDAVMAGLPWNAHVGQWVLPNRDGASGTATCGACTRCLVQCPTQAFTGPFMLDARKCISYWTIEARGPAPRHLRAGFGNRIFGCDVCQEVCPWNRDAPGRGPRIAALRDRDAWRAPPLLEGFRPDRPYWLSDAAFRDHFRGSPVKRAKRPGMLRNVCTALGNWGDPAALPALIQARDDPAEAVRLHAVWALGRIWARTGHPAARACLQQVQAAPATRALQEEAERALGQGLDAQAISDLPAAPCPGTGDASASRTSVRDGTPSPKSGPA